MGSIELVSSLSIWLKEHGIVIPTKKDVKTARVECNQVDLTDRLYLYAMYLAKFVDPDIARHPDFQYASNAWNMGQVFDYTKKDISEDRTKKLKFPSDELLEHIIVETSKMLDLASKNGEIHQMVEIIPNLKSFRQWFWNYPEMYALSDRKLKIFLFLSYHVNYDDSKLLEWQIPMVIKVLKDFLPYVG